jgi:hypothetical protein
MQCVFYTRSDNAWCMIACQRGGTEALVEQPEVYYGWQQILLSWTDCMELTLSWEANNVLSDNQATFRLCLFVCFWRYSSQWTRFSSFTRFLDHTQRRTTVGNPLDEWWARSKDLYLTKYNTQNWLTSIPPMGFEPTISADKRPQTYALDRVATATGTFRLSLPFSQETAINPIRDSWIWYTLTEVFRDFPQP